MGKKAVLHGALVQTVVFTVLLLLGPPKAVYGLSVVIGGLIGGATSDRYESEFLDGAATGVLGLGLSLVVFVGLLWTNTSALPPDLRIELAFVTLVQGLGYLIVLVPLAGIAGAIVGQFGARF